MDSGTFCKNVAQQKLIRLVVTTKHFSHSKLKKSGNQIFFAKRKSIIFV